MESCAVSPQMLSFILLSCLLVSFSVGVRCYMLLKPVAFAEFSVEGSASEPEVTKSETLKG